MLDSSSTSARYQRHLPCIHLTFDVEEQPPFKLDPPEKDDCLFSREGCHILIDLLHECNIKATFFVTGYFAEKNPDIVKSLRHNGHEIAHHSYRHEGLKGRDRGSLESEIKRSTDILSRLAGEKIRGFRAPFFSYPKDLPSLLKAYGYQYDSSLHPAVVPGKYYNFRSPLSPFQMENGIWEIPISVIPCIRFPISWWWMRNVGGWITYTGTTINLHSKRNVVLYFHSWEFIDLADTGKTPRDIIRNTGKKFCGQLKKFIRFYKNRDIDFLPVIERIPLLPQGHNAPD